MLFLSLEEMERLFYDQFVQSLTPNEVDHILVEHTDEFLPSVFARKYLAYLYAESTTSTDERRKYVTNFIILASEFRRFWKAIRNGCRITQEVILTNWVGIFSLLNKFNYVDIALNQMEREYHDITYKELEELRQNSLLRLNTSHKIEATSKFVAPDEAQEIINWMTKLLPLGSDTESWLYHSRNLMFASKSNAYEKQGQVNHNLQYDDSEENIINKIDVTKTKSTTEPRKNIERYRLYE